MNCDNIILMSYVIMGLQAGLNILLVLLYLAASERRKEDEKPTKVSRR